MIQLHQILVENVDYLYSCLNSETDHNFLAIASIDLSKEDSLWAYVNYYSLGLIDCKHFLNTQYFYIVLFSLIVSQKAIGNTYPKTLQINSDKSIVEKLNHMLQEYCWLPTKAEIGLKETCLEMNASNTLIIIRLLIRHFSILDNDTKFKVFSILKVIFRKLKHIFFYFTILIFKQKYSKITLYISWLWSWTSLYVEISTK